MFSKDTTILVWGPLITSVSTQPNDVADTISSWAHNNKMALNNTKTTVYIGKQEGYYTLEEQNIKET